MFQQLALPLSITQEMTFNNFHISSANGDALAWLHLWPRFPLSQCVIHGEKGCGKTHLAMALLAKTKGIYVCGKGALPELSILFQSRISVLIIDDYTSIKEEEWLFHVYNMAKESNIPVVYFGDISPAKHSFYLNDVSSRMRSLHAIEITTPDDDLFKKILQKNIQFLGASYTDDIGEYLLKRLERSYAAIHDMISRIDQVTLQNQRVLTLPVVREILGEVIAEEDAIPSSHMSLTYQQEMLF